LNFARFAPGTRRQARPAALHECQAYLNVVG